MTESSPALVERLLDRRIALLHGRLDRRRATETAAMLLTLDAESKQPITLHIDSSGDDVGAALMLADTMDLLRAPVHIVCTGEVAGPPVALLSSAEHREATPNARFVLREPRFEATGTVAEVTTLAAQHAAMLAQLCRRLAALTSRATEQIAEDMRPPGLLLTADEAVAYGLVEQSRQAPG